MIANHCLLLIFLSVSKSRKGEGSRICIVAVWGRRWRGMQGTFPVSMWDGGKGCEEAVHMPSCVTYVTKKHRMFVKQTLTYLAVIIIQWRRGQDSGGAGGRGEDRELGKERVRWN